MKFISHLVQKEVFMKEIIKFHKVTKSYQIGEKEFKALDDVSLSIMPGEFVVILGPSGAGKSTLLNLLGGMDKVTHGTITVDEKNITKYNDKMLTKYRAEKIGFIFQFYNILPTLTVLENVKLINNIVKNPKDAETVLKEVGLKKHLNKFPSNLSGGEQQRVSIARAIAKDAPIILADEPSGALDSKTGVEIIKLLKNECLEENGKKTVIIVTHNALIADVADRVITLKNGKVELDEINKHPKNIDEVKW